MFNLKADCQIKNDSLRSLREASNDQIGLTLAKVKEVASLFFNRACAVSHLSDKSTFNRVFLVTVPAMVSDYEVKERKYVIRFLLPLFSGYEILPFLQQWVNHECILERVATPKIIVSDTSHKLCPFDFQIIDFLEGDTLFDIRYDEQAVCNVLSEVVAELGKVHLIGGKQFGLPGYPEKTWYDYLNSDFESNLQYLLTKNLIDGNQYKEIKDIFYKHLIDFVFSSGSLLHGDLSYNNIIVKDGKLAGILDWEDALYGDPLFDLANLATFHPERRHKYIIGNTKFLPSAYDKFWLYFLRISISKTVQRHRFGYIDKVEPGFLAADDRIKLAMTRLRGL